MQRLHFRSVSFLAVLVASGCVLVAPFDYDREGAGLGGNGASSPIGGTPPGVGGAGASAIGGEASGGGGGDPCEGIDLSNDPLHCGSCTFECGGKVDCVDGRCAQVIDLGGDALYSLVVDDSAGEIGMLYVVASDVAEDSAHIYALPLDFTAESVPTLVHTVADSDPGSLNLTNWVGTLVRGTQGPKHIYYNAQATSVILACDVSGCTPTDLGPDHLQISFLSAAVGDRFYFGSFASYLYSVGLDAQGLPIPGDPPGSAVTLEVASHESPFGNGGIAHVVFSPPETLYWASQVYDTGDPDGCIFRALLSELATPDPLANRPCWSSRFTAAGFAVGDDGAVYAQDGWNQATLSPFRVRKFAPVTAVENEFFANNTDFPRAVDGERLYTSTRFSLAGLGAGDLRMISLDGSGDVVLAPGASAGAIDVSNNDYVFYASGSRVHRVPKP
jgi:hypothetical protein